MTGFRWNLIATLLAVPAFAQAPDPSISVDDALAQSETQLKEHRMKLQESLASVAPKLAEVQMQMPVISAQLDMLAKIPPFQFQIPMIHAELDLLARFQP